MMTRCEMWIIRRVPLQRDAASHSTLDTRHATLSHAFTLMEMLVVISLFVLLISMLMPSLRQAKLAGLDTECSAQLKQATYALDSYLIDENDTIFWRGTQVWRDDPIVTGMDWYVYAGQEKGNRYSGGQGNFFNALQPRPMNKYLGNNHEAMRCPYDVRPWAWAQSNAHFDWVGNSYIFNNFGSPQVGPSLGIGLAGIRSARIADPSLTILFLDCSLVRSPASWHQQSKGNIAFVDNHVELLEYPWIDNDRGITWDPY